MIVNHSFLDKIEKNYVRANSYRETFQYKQLHLCNQLSSG